MSFLRTDLVVFTIAPSLLALSPLSLVTVFRLSSMNTVGKRLVPLLDRVIVRKFKPAEKTASGLFIPEKSQESLQQGEVLAVGPGDKDYKMALKTGDKIILPGFGGMSFKLDDEVSDVP